jgi:hypothetical protein
VCLCRSVHAFTRVCLHAHASALAHNLLDRIRGEAEQLIVELHATITQMAVAMQR